MGLNIKNQKTYHLIQELAALQGVSMVAAVTNAVEEKLEKEKGREARKGLAASLERLSRETSAMTRNGRTSIEMLADLYDEKTGLPK